MNENVQRVIQEYVPGKQVTLAHIIVNPDNSIYKKLGLEENHNSIGILTITPSEAAIIAADVAVKSGDVTIGYVDRFNGSLVIEGDVGSVEASVESVLQTLSLLQGMSIPTVTRS
ncbi:BMC domain-containing protein [Acetobacterium carbinolicum]|jgi:ethanolamine utilization protein EutS|uniref:BMC domain-containing protein n=1 Tax=Acetobacterium TaxID=33951 RepID=UPI000DBEB65A|nr:MULTISPECIES: BMC domain-containing protein [unclassified Acetobacterium]AWW25849.1 propanediol utilization protein [Acetobacterium sp. KB-1]MDK2941135.1 ethanolamine utilization protein EutS [Acetobacterium sp.]MDZ5725901.1 BMC domain-containing protein [Acetobacterium sp. K1/6]